MRKIQIIPFLLFCFFLMVSITPKAFSQNNKCPEKDKFKKLIIAAINLTEFQQYFKAQKIINQPNLVIVKNNLIKDDINIKKFDLPVLFLTEQQIIDIKIKAFIRFIKIEIEGDFATVKLQYKIQGLYCSSYYKLENCEWKSIQSKFVEN